MAVRVSYRCHSVHINSPPNDVIRELSDMPGWTRWTDLVSVTTTGDNQWDVVGAQEVASSVTGKFVPEEGIADLTWTFGGTVWPTVGRVVGLGPNRGSILTVTCAKPDEAPEDAFRSMMGGLEENLERLQKMMEEGKPSLTSPPTLGVAPYLVVPNGAEAIKFYVEVLGAREQMRQVTPDGKVVHCSLALEGGTLMLSEDFPEMNDGEKSSPTDLGGSPVTLHLAVANVDTVVEKAVARGAKVKMPASDAFWGDRFAKFQDPAGHLWSVSHPLKSVSQTEMKESVDKFFGEPEEKKAKA